MLEDHRVPGVAPPAAAASLLLPELRWCVAVSAASVVSSAIIYGLDVLTAQEVASPDSQGRPPVVTPSGASGGSQGPPFFVEGLRAKPAVDGSLELSEAESALGRG